jgi:hypothetical protein
MRTSLDRPGTSSSVSMGGATSRGGAGGQGDGGSGTGTKGTGGSGGITASGGSAGSGGLTGSGGLLGSGGRSGRGGVAGTGGTVASGGVTGTGGSVGSGGAVSAGGSSSVVGTGGAVGRGGTTGEGGIGGTGGSTGSSVFGMPCTSDQDCPPDATCCDGSDESCDGTMLPSGNSANPGEFLVSADGLTVTDTITGLVWQRDGSGTRSGCSRGADAGSGDLTCTWAEARAYCASLTLGGVSDWRLPAVLELYTIVDFTGTNATIDPVAFPNTPADLFWASAPHAANPGVVSFDTGSSGIGDLYNYHIRVRCVRGLRCYPTNRFVVISGGLVHDTLTDLVWQQQASTTTMSLTDAQTYCSSAGSGFRLPTLKELQSIVDHTVTSGPPIDQTAFPNTPEDGFWPSQPCAGSSCPEWGVSFGSTSGYTFYNSGTSLSLSLEARCVR